MDARDLQEYSNVAQIAVEELLDEAMTGNLSRRHHLESALACFKSIQTILDAEAIIKEMFQDALVDEEDSTHDDTRE